jgi:hypothetical protein
MITCELKVGLQLGVVCKYILGVSRSSSIMMIFQQFLPELCPFLNIKFAKYLVSRQPVNESQIEATGRCDM